MSTWLYVLPGEGVQLDRQTSCWVVRDGRHQPLQWAQAQALLSGQAVRLVLPAEWSGWFLGERWPGRRRPSIKALSYAIEESLAVDLDELHLVAGRADHPRRHALRAIEKRGLAQVLSCLAEGGVKVLSVSIDVDLLPRGKPCVAWLAGRWLLDDTGAARMALSSRTMTLFSSRLAPDLCWLNDEQAEPGMLLDAWESNLPRSTDLLPHQGTRAGLSWLVSAALASAAGLLCVSLVADFSHSQLLQSQAEVLRASSESKIRTIYPHVQGADLDHFISSLTPVAQTRPGPLVQLSAVARQLMNGGALQVQTLRYVAGQGWDIRFSADNLAMVERLRAAAGLRLGSARQSAEGVSGVFYLSGENQ